MTKTFLSHFTPSLMSREALEAIFVQREELARLLVDRIHRGTLGPKKEHSLLAGPRGIGKTHLVSIVYYRLRAIPELNDRLLIAWLREEEWGITTVLDVLLRVFRALPPELGSSRFPRRMELLYELRSEQAEAEAAAVLRDIVGGRTLLIIVENLDDLFKGLGNVGQHKLRQFLRDNRFCMLLATAPALFDGVLLENAPFNLFFNIHELEGLSFEDACAMLTKLAAFTHDPELATFISRPLGRARIRALRYLAGGNHRLYMVFSQFLTRESLEDLIEPLVKTIDDLTPYYQSRMSGLTPKQRKIVEWICERRRPVPLPEIEQRCFLSRQAATAQLQQLRDMGYIRSYEAGEDVYYDLREPLMRLSIEVKKHRGEPIRLLVDFLRLWYSPTELRHRLGRLHEDAVLERQYAAPALEPTGADHFDPRLAVCCRDYTEAVQRGDLVQALRAAEELVVVRGVPQDWMAQIYCLKSLNRTDEAAAACERVVALNRNDSGAWYLRGQLLQRLDRVEDAVGSFDQALLLDENLVGAWVSRAEALMELGRTEEALRSCQRALRLKPGDPHVWLLRGMALGHLERYEEAIEVLEKASELDPGNADAWVYRGAAQFELKRHEEALTCAEQAIQLEPATPQAWIIRASALGALGRADEALTMFNKALELGEDSSFVRYKRAELLFKLGRWYEASAALDEALAWCARRGIPDRGNTGAMARTLLEKISDVGQVGLSVRLLVLLYQKHDALNALAHGVVESISGLDGSPDPGQISATWRDIWRQEAGSLHEFELALRLMDSAVRFLADRDLRVLLELPHEERVLLEPLVGVQPFGTGTHS